MILCLGPHRTGTSAVTAAIAALGADLGFDAAYSNEENQKGFFEHDGVLALNERLLARLGGSWDAPAFVGRAAIAQAGAGLDDLAAEAVSLLARDFATSDLAVLKDPRLCLLLDFWLPVLGQAGFRAIDLVHVVRDPAEAALSQHTRAERNPDFYEIGRDLSEGTALWLSHMGQMWDGFDQARHLVLAYDSLVDAPDATLIRLAGFLKLTPDPGRVAQYSKNFLDPSLRRSRAPLGQDDAANLILPLARQVYQMVLPLCDRAELKASDVARVLALYRKPATALAIDLAMRASVARLSGAARAAKSERSRLRDEVAEAQRAVEALDLYRKSQAEDYEREMALARAAMAALQTSRSWKITAPLRDLGSGVRRLAKRGTKGWIQFYHLAKRSYRGLQRRAPWLAEALRKVLAPLVRAGNRAILHSDYVPVRRLLAGGVRGQNPFVFDYQLPKDLKDFRPLVSILVPNFNHAPYLRQRLDTIYAQTWTNFEVLLMDDCSTDASRAILQEYADRFPDRTRVIFNEVNSGGPFYQWEKGLRDAKGEVIWVAESDDWSSENFLETLVPFFANPAVQLAFAPTTFMNAEGSAQVWSMEDYLADLGPGRWARPFVRTAAQIVREAFGEKNIIPNVSSAVFRKIDRLEVLESHVWRSMRTCGDWVFYLNQIRGGLVAYSPDAQNFYRLHPTNTSVRSFSKDSYYIEHEEVAKTIQRHYRVDPSVFRRQRQNLILHWKRNRPSFDQAEFDRSYSLSRIAAEGAKRKPRLLMASYAFCSGGGETFPITLANEMKTAGYDVTFLNCDQEDEIKGIRDLLAKDIPIVSDYESLTDIVRDFEIEVIHSHHAWVDSTILDILPETSAVKTVVTLHGMYETIDEDRLRRILPRLVKRTARMVYIAEKNIAALVSRGLATAGDLARIDNALPKGSGVPVDRAGLGIAADAFVLTLVSRAIPEKGWQEAIDAVTRAREISGKDIQLILVGGGQEHDRLSGKVAPFVHLTGFRSNTRDYFATADMGFLPSRFKGESFPLVIIDCLNAGRPVLTSDLGEIPYMLTTLDGIAGVIFPLQNWQVPIEPLAQSIADLATHRDRVVKMAGRVAEAARRFDPELMRNRYDEVYLGVMAQEIAGPAARQDARQDARPTPRQAAE